MITFNPGPSQISKDCEREMVNIVKSGLLSLSHRSEEISSLCLETLQAVRKALNVPDNFSIFFQPSATACMETCLRNFVDDKSFHFVHGAFSNRFYQTALDIGLKAKAFNSPDSQAVSWKSAVFDKAELIAITINETSSGLFWPKDELQNLRQNQREALIALDATSLLAGAELDWESFDICFASVQKCLGLPSGLALFFANQKALEKAKKRQGIADWQKLETLAKKIQKGQTIETPNLFLILLLGRQMKDYDLRYQAKRLKIRAENIYEQFRPYVENKQWRSPTVINLLFDDPASLKEKAIDAGYILGNGYNKLKTSCIRLANFPSIEDQHFQNIIEILNP